MTPRETAGVREMRLLVEYFDRRNAENAGDAAEMKIAIEEMAAKLVDQEA